jgi:DMSO/TMAO reductase YedYZ molybdopterin-dependent catalytic subunit
MTAELLTIDGQVGHRVELSLADLQRLPEAHQVADIRQLDPSRQGQAVRLKAILELVQPHAAADYLTLHASTDNFHVSIPLADVRERAVIIYAIAGEALPRRDGGPTRFFIADHAACHTAEIDECANVKYLDRIEFTAGRGQDNRPTDEAAHRKLHDEQS